MTDRWSKVLGTTLCLSALGACGTAAAPQYFTLVQPVTHAANTTPAADFAIELLAVDVPQQVDTPLMVVRSGSGQITPVESRRWIAPLPDELRAAYSNSITATLGARDVNGMVAQAATTYRIKVVVRRFDSTVGVSADVDAVWSIHDTRGGSALTCEAHVSEPAQGDYEALALAHQRAAADIAQKISATILAMRSDAQGAACPK